MMQLQNLFCDCQPYPRTVFSGREKGNEYFLSRSRVHTFAVVSYMDAYPSFIVAESPQMNECIILL